MASLSAAAASGDRRAALEALRTLLAASLEEVDPDKRAPLARQLRETLADLAALHVPEEESVSDDLAAKRAARRAAAKVAAPAAGSDH